VWWKNRECELDAANTHTHTQTHTITTTAANTLRRCLREGKSSDEPHLQVRRKAAGGGEVTTAVQGGYKKKRGVEVY
jgi:hypothetical protein